MPGETMSFTPSSAYLAMPDAVNVNLLPVGYPAYLGYTDGAFATATALERMFPDASLVLLTVMAGTLGAHGARVAVNPGADTEPGDLRAVDAANWARRQIEAAPGTRPVIYASVIGQPGYGMSDVLVQLGHVRVLRTSVRLLSAHYGLGPHVCGPATCKAISTGMDGTQWTDSYPVPGGVVDMSMLKPGFFGAPAPAPITETERLVRELGTVRQGDTGAMVRNVQALCVARGHDVTIDGVFGMETRLAVIESQQIGKVTADGIVGPQTWPVLLGVV